MLWPLLLPATLSALAYLFLTTRPASLLRSATKTASVALLAASAWAGGLPTLLVLALALCALGDWLLSRETDAAFMTGVGAFAAGHVAYAALFLSRPVADPARIMTPPMIWIALALVLFGAVVARVLARRAGALRGPVLGYVPVIIGMGLSALTLPADGRLALVLPAALSFVASDLILAAEKFLLAESHPARGATPYAVWVLYWGAQAGFLAAFA